MRSTTFGAWWWPALLSAVVWIGCDDDPAGGEGDEDAGGDAADAGEDAAPLPMDGLYGPATTEIRVEIDYEEGAEPYTGESFPFGDPWDLFLNNVGDLFAEQPKTLTVPTTLEGMEMLTELDGPDFTAAEILAIAGEHRDESDAAGVRSFYVVFLDGWFADDTGRRDGVLGVSLGGTTVVAIFKQPIESTTLPRQVEQVTLVHEFGHAAGLVNNGVPMVDPHQDEEHGAHCDNPDCVMYWAVEGADIIGYVQERVLSSAASVFGEECLEDARAAGGE